MLVVTPADQMVTDTVAFTAAVQQAIAQAEQGSIVNLGVTPDKPETGDVLATDSHNTLVHASSRVVALAPTSATS